MAVDKNWYWTVSSQKEVTKLLDWLKAQGERIDNSFGHTDTLCYISYDVLRGEWHLVKSCDVLYSNKSFQSLLPWESEESKFIAGKWYKINNCWYAKFKTIHNSGNCWQHSEVIDYNGSYRSEIRNLDNNWKSIPIVLLEDLSEIQQYLPDRHPDKISIISYPKFEVGRWYKYKNWYIKYDNHYQGRWTSSEEINGKGGYTKRQGMFGGREFDNLKILLTDLSEIQQYLPDGHPDKIGDKKIEELTEFPLLGFCKTKSSELKAYLENKFPAQEKTSKWDDDNYKLIAWNYTAYWLCKEKSDRPEYTIEQLQKFFNKKSITEKLLEEAKLKYPVGTKIQKCLDGWSEDGETNIISGIPYNTVSGLIWVKGSKHDLCIYHNGRWAEIISLPEPEIETPNVEKIIDFQKQGRPIMDCSGSTTGVIVKNPTSNFSKQIDKTPEFLMLDSEVVEFQALPKRKPVSIQLIGID